ncbi:hypothetical protein [Fibrobacter sp.]|uniref:hypothetical protein n=1 Tax=Fibrobacter sp. TaxID=35828 RepID=UPI0025BF65B4|nr:hypothetical protein [Fibrobacter sp.]MBR3072931.1 hypothetical protein [Fibrobacter sp.]
MGYSKESIEKEIAKKFLSNFCWLLLGMDRRNGGSHICMEILRGESCVADYGG